MSNYRIEILDVFAEQQLAGNQLAVVYDAADLTSAQMQAIALETNFSETTFVINHGDGRAEVRIFTPNAELPFAGHPTLGTAWALTRGQGSITLDLAAGAVDVGFEDGIGWMHPPDVTFVGECEVSLAAPLLGLSERELNSDWPIDFAQVGPQFVLIPVRDLTALKRAQLDASLHRELVADGLGVQCVFAFSSEPYTADADFASRMFFDANGVREDPATGSANTAFAAYLRRHALADGRVIVDQGVEIGRPSRLYLRLEDQLAVGGRVHSVIEGTLTLEH